MIDEAFFNFLEAINEDSSKEGLQEIDMLKLSRIKERKRKNQFIITKNIIFTINNRKIFFNKMKNIEYAKK